MYEKPSTLKDLLLSNKYTLAEVVDVSLVNIGREPVTIDLNLSNLQALARIHFLVGMEGAFLLRLAAMVSKNSL